MLEKRVGAVSIWFFKTFLKYDNVLHFVSSRVGGVSKAPYAFLNLGFHVGDDPQNVLQNRKLLASTLGIPLDCFTTAKQIHDGNVKIITEQLKGCVYNALENSWYFNLWEANKAQLLQMGIPAQNIEMAGLCTYCNSDKFFSARHQRGKTGRFGVGIMLKDE
ncbi:hypothetical protein B5M50_04545 [candidate division KSB1 bacterium 4484_219]|nr:MAG: hypothetical protein B5M50_04545 [candidate division KSB1 bacterium 4484_219]